LYRADFSCSWGSIVLHFASSGANSCAYGYIDRLSIGAIPWSVVVAHKRVKATSGLEVRLRDFGPNHLCVDVEVGTPGFYLCDRVSGMVISELEKSRC
jgi:hypothetical protein